jgi:hypothetical protein
MSTPPLVVESHRRWPFTTRQDRPSRRILSRAQALVAIFLILPACVAMPVREVRAEPGTDTVPKAPKVSGARFRSVAETKEPTDGVPIPFVIEVTGEHFGTSAAAVSGPQLTTAAGVDLPSQIVSVTDTSILIRSAAPVGTTITAVSVSVGGTLLTAKDTLTLKKADDQAPVEEFEFKMTATRDEQYPSLMSLVLVTEKDNFSHTQFENSVEIIPHGIANLQIQPESNPRSLVVSFLAPEKFEPKDVIVTVYKGTDLASRRTLRAGKLVKEFKANPDQPVVKKTEVLFVQRKYGIGRLRIEGNGFGTYEDPPFPADLYVAKWAQVRARQREFNKEYFETFWNDADYVRWKEWYGKVEKRVQVIVIPKNPTLRVERAEVVEINDKMIDVYFEFTRYEDYSQPFRVGSVAVTVDKPVKKVATIKAGAVAAVTESLSDQTFLVSSSVGPKVDENLEYRYSVLDKVSARYLFGSGIAENFYVIQISIVNRGPKKVSVPLASIQAEVEWAALKERPSRQRDGGSVAASTTLPLRFFLEGPATLPPIPLAAVSAYFDADRKTRGKRARFFNVLDGLATLGSSLVPVFGPGLRDAHVIFTGGLIPGAKTAVGDLSSQQLQNLTGLSFESVEVLAAGGGSIERYIYIQRGVQEYSSNDPALKPQIRKEIKNIVGLEVVGFEVSETDAKTAVEQ